MTLLLKSMWQNVLKSYPLSRSALRSCSISSSLLHRTLVGESRARSPDPVLARLRAAPSAGALLAAVQAHLPNMDHRHLLTALRCLFELHKAGDEPAGESPLLAAVQAHLPNMDHRHLLTALRCLFELHKAGELDGNPQTIIKDPAFGVLCQNFKKHARSLDVNEAIEATKVLSYLQVPADSLIVQTMLQLIRHDINLINIRQIMFLDFILSRFDCKNHMVDALKLALPLTFQIRLPLELDNEDLPLLRDMLTYSCNTDLPDRCINNIVTGLLLHDQAIDAQNAKSIIWSLCQVNCTEEKFPTRVQLLHICFDILTQRLNELTYDELLRTAAKLKGRITEKHPEYYHEQLMDAIANYVVENEVEFEKALLVGRVLSRIAHTHLGLVHYLCESAAANPDTLAKAKTNILFGFINCLSNNNYTPNADQWEELRNQISRNPVLDSKNTALPWAKLCLELASLNHYEDKVLSRVFSKEFLDEYLSRVNNTLDYLQLLTLQEAVKTFHSKEYSLPAETLAVAKSKYPTHATTEQLRRHLAAGLGGAEYTVKDVVLPNGIITDILICLKGGYPVPLTVPENMDRVPYERLNLPQNSVPVCVMNFNQGCFSQNSNRLRGTFRLVLDVLERQGFVAVAVNAGQWGAAPAHERAPYLLREVAHKAAEIGVKLSAV